MRAWNKKNKKRASERDRRSKLKKKYGISVEVYDKMFKSQEGACAICKQKPAKKRLAVDHCHRSSKVRALLCFHCNTGIGQFRDNEALLKKAIAYLKKHR